MQLFDPNNPNEKKKIIVAAVLGFGAILVLGYVFFGGSSNKPPVNNQVRNATPAPMRKTVTPLTGDGTVDVQSDDPSTFRPVPTSITIPQISETGRNIFAYYEPPPPTPKVVIVPTPAPAPPPPVTITALSPSNVYARTPSDFALQIMGDKFTPALRILIDGRDLPTRFINAQQVAATVPASLITNPGNREVMVKSTDGKLYSNKATFTVTQPPVPDYSYVGVIAKPRFNDTAILQDKSSKEILNVQRGDVVGGRFRVNSISEHEIVFIDTTLKIRHTIPFSADTSPNQLRPPVRVDEEPD
jgi:hypothetical protein